VCGFCIVAVGCSPTISRKVAGEAGDRREREEREEGRWWMRKLKKSPMIVEMMIMAITITMAMTMTMIICRDGCDDDNDDD
jgi:cell division protein FtsX